MTWVPLLLADPSPCLRRLVLRELLGRGDDDPEVRELDGLVERDPLVLDLLALQGPDGSWQAGDLAWTAHASKVRGTALALLRLGYLGFGPEKAAVRRGAEYLFSVQRADGAWELADAGAEDVAAADAADEGRAEPDAADRPPLALRGVADEAGPMMPLQTAIPLRGLAACGYAETPRAERAYDWLLARRLPDGAWPTGVIGGNYRRVGGYRRLAHSRWGCRSNTTGALLCLALHTQRRNSPEARRALDLLLGRDSHEQSTLGWEVARVLGLEPFRGNLTFYARYDLGLMLDLCRRVGAGRDDNRVTELAGFVQSLQGPYGLWEYPARPQASRWLTFDLLRSLADVDAAGDWLSDEPPTPFQSYTRVRRRY